MNLKFQYYNEDDISNLEDLYEDLKLHQKDELTVNISSIKQSLMAKEGFILLQWMFIEFVKDNPDNHL